MPNGRCKMHGGKSLVGMAAPGYKHGRYSRYLPTRMADRFAEAQHDPTLLELRADVALTDTRIEDVLGRVDTGESGQLWREAKIAYDGFRASTGTGDTAKAMVALEELERLLIRGQADWHAWDEIGKLLEQRRRLVESERRYLIEQKQMITSERAMLLIGAVASIIRTHVNDRDTLAAISADLSRLLGSGASTPALNGADSERE